MANKNANPYLTQALSVLTRTTGVAPSRVRALGFLQHKLREGQRDAAAAARRPREDGPARDGAGQSDRG